MKAKDAYRLIDAAKQTDRRAAGDAIWTLLADATEFENVSIKLNYGPGGYSVLTAQDGDILRDRNFGCDKAMALSALRLELDWATGESA